MEIEWTDVEIVLDVVVGCFRLLFGILARIVISTKEPFLDWSREELSWLGHCVRHFVSVSLRIDPFDSNLEAAISQSAQQRAPERHDRRV